VASLLDSLGREPAGEIRDVIFGRMADALFQEHPEARTVRLQIEEIEMPTGIQFRKGGTASLKPLYGYDFTRTEAGPSPLP